MRLRNNLGAGNTFSGGAAGKISIGINRPNRDANGSGMTADSQLSLLEHFSTSRSEFTPIDLDSHGYSVIRLEGIKA